MLVTLPDVVDLGEHTVEVRVTVEVGDMVWPGQAVGWWTRVCKLPYSGDNLSVLEIVEYTGLCEAEVVEVITGARATGDSILALREIRQVADRVCAPVGGIWYPCVDKGEEMLKPGQELGRVESINPREQLAPVIFLGSAGSAAKLLWVSSGVMGFVSEGDTLVIYQTD